MRRLGLTSAFALALVAAALVLARSGGAATADQLNEAGKAAYARGEYATAADLFAQAIARDARQPLFHYHRAVALTRLHRWREANDAFLAAQQLNPPSPLAALIRDGLKGLPASRRAPRATDTVSVALRPFGGVWLAAVVVNDQRPARFVVDTGATLCVLSPALAEAVGVEPKPEAPVIQLQTVNGRASGRLVSIPSVRVGDAEARGVAAVILPLGPDLDGLLGNSFLARFGVTLDADRGLLLLHPRP